MVERYQYQQIAQPVEPQGSPVEDVTLDKWWTPTSQPLFETPRLDFFDRYFVIDPDELAAIPPPDFSWWTPASEPARDYERWEWIYPHTGAFTNIEVPPGARYVTADVRITYQTHVEIVPTYGTSISVAPA